MCRGQKNFWDLAPAFHLVEQSLISLASLQPSWPESFQPSLLPLPRILIKVLGLLLHATVTPLHLAFHTGSGD